MELKKQNEKKNMELTKVKETLEWTENERGKITTTGNGKFYETKSEDQTRKGTSNTRCMNMKNMNWHKNLKNQNLKYWNLLKQKIKANEK